MRAKLVQPSCLVIVLTLAFSLVATCSNAQIAGISVKDAPYNALGNGVHDDTPALIAAYNAAKAAQLPLVFPTGDYIFTSTLVWDGQVNVIGAGMGGVGAGRVVILDKTGDFVGIKISAGGASGVTYSNFNLYRTGTDHSNGIEVDAQGSTNWRLENIDVQSQGGHGLVIRSGKNGMVTNLATSSNGGDGLRVESQSGVTPSFTADSCVFTNIVSSGNGGHGFNIVAGNTHTGTGVVSQNNTQYGVRLNGLHSMMQVYSESNLGGAVKLDTGSASNYVVILTAGGSGSQADLNDLGTTNVILDMGHGIFWMPLGWQSPALPPPPSTLPRLTQIQRDQLVNPPEGMMIWNITTVAINLRRAGIWQSLP